MMAITLIATPFVFVSCGDDDEDATTTVSYDNGQTKAQSIIGFKDTRTIYGNDGYEVTVDSVRTIMITTMFSSVGQKYDAKAFSDAYYNIIINTEDEDKMLNAMQAAYAQLKDVDMKAGLYEIKLTKEGSRIAVFQFGTRPTGTKFTVDFEDVPLNNDNYWKGDSLTGTLHESQYGNTWSCTYTEGVATINMTLGTNYWLGFAISARKENSYNGQYGTADEFNNIKGGAYSGNNFLVAQQSMGDDCISFEKPVTIMTFNYVNSVVPMYSIINGDSFIGEKFDKSDWFKCTVIGTRSDNTTVTCDLDLVKDFKYVSDWKRSPILRDKFKNIVKLTFSFSSSRNNANGNVLPAYMCVDRIIGYIE